MDRIQGLVETFHLEEQVAEFVRGRVRDLVAKRHDFSFRGGLHHCGGDDAHPPHMVSHYHTERFGAFELFCTGHEGHTPEGYLTIVVMGRAMGGAAWPASAHGYWWVTP